MHASTAVPRKKVSGACLNWMAISVSHRVIASPERKIERHAGPAPIVDQQAKRDVSLGL